MHRQCVRVALFVYLASNPNVEFIAFILLQGFPRLIVHFLEVLISRRDWTVCMNWDVPRALCGLGFGDACAEENAMHRNLSELLSYLACESSAAFIAFVFHADTRLASPRLAVRFLGAVWQTNAMNAAFTFALQDKKVIATRTHFQSIHFSECFLSSLH